MIAKSLHSVSKSVTDPARAAYFWLKRPRNSAICAMHGIQRSGTNYLEACLGKLKIYPLNRAVVVERTHPRHKHFRWNRDKFTIPQFIAHEYLNDVVAGSVAELNAQARYPARCKHIVMQKSKPDWLASACNWGLRVGWFADVEEALTNVAAMEADYDAYYGFWQGLAAATPERILILDIDVVRVDFAVMLAGFDRLGVRYRWRAGFDGRIERVVMSPHDRQKTVRVRDVAAWRTGGGKR